MRRGVFAVGRLGKGLRDDRLFLRILEAALRVEVVDAAQRSDTDQRIRRALARLEVVRVQRDERGEVRARAATRERDPRGVVAVLLRVLEQERERRGHVFRLTRVGILRRSAVSDQRDGRALVLERPRETVRQLAQAPVVLPEAALHEREQRRARAPRRGQEEIERGRAVGVARVREPLVDRALGAGRGRRGSEPQQERGERTRRRRPDSSCPARRITDSKIFETLWPRAATKGVRTIGARASR